MIELKANLLEKKKEDLTGVDVNSDRKLNNYDNFILDSQLTQVDCVMNHLCIFDDVEYTAYSCPSCPEKLDYVCYLCYQNCHKGHGSNLKNSGSTGNLAKKISIKNQKCQCALHDHMKHSKTGVENTKYNRGASANLIELENESHLCPINEIISTVDPQSYFLDKKSNNYFCIYCVYYCLEVEDPLKDNTDPGLKFKNSPKNLNHIDENEMEDSVEESKYEFSLVDSKIFSNGNYPKCFCSKSENHFPFEENLNNICTLISDKRFDKFINRYKFPSQFFNNECIIRKYFDAYLTKQEQLKKLLQDGRVYEAVEMNNFYDERIYNTSVNVIKSLCSTYTSKLSFYEVIQKDSRFINVLGDIDYLINFFSLPEKNADQLFKMKLDTLNFYRKFIFSPKFIRNRNFFGFENFGNLSPFHRLVLANKADDEILTMYLGEEENEQKLEELGNFSGGEINPNYTFSKVEVLLEKIYESLLSYSDKYIDETEYMLYGVEFLKLYNLIIPYFYLFPIKYEQAFSRVTKVITILASKKTQENLVRNTLEKIVYNLVHISNDFVIYSNLFQEGRANYNHLTENSSFFSFQHQNTFIKDCIVSLFQYLKEPTDKSIYLIRNDLYDILVNQHDFYSESIKNFHYSNEKFSFFTDEYKHLILSFREKKDYLLSTEFLTKFFKEDNDNIDSHNRIGRRGSRKRKALEENLLEGEINSSGNELKESKSLYWKTSETLKQLLKLNSLIEELFLNLSYSNIKEAEYFKELEKILENLHQILIHEYLEFNNFDVILEQNVQILNKKQILYSKFGGLDILLNLCKIFKRVKYFSNKDLYEAKNKCQDKVLKILDVLTIHNPFLTTLFFNCSVIKILVKNNQLLDASSQMNNNSIKFFYKKLKTLTKYEYKVSTEFLIDLIINQFEFDAWRSTNENLQDSGDSMLKLILKMFTLSLKITSDKSLMFVNDKITTKLAKILTSEEFKTELDELYVYYYQNISTESPIKKKRSKEDDIKRKDSLIEEGRQTIKTNVYTIQTENSLQVSNAPIPTQIVKLIYTCVNDLAPEYFVLIIKFLHTEKISKILSLHCELDPELRRILTKTYSRFFVQDFFKINLQVNDEILKKYLLGVDTNLFMRIIENESETNQEPVITGQYDNKLDKLGRISEKNSEKFDSDEDMSETKSKKKRMKREESVEQLLQKVGLDPLMKNFQKYRVTYHNLESHFRKDLHFSVRYFEDVILFPTFFTIYKISYFAKDVAAKLKYIIYNIVYLFINCFKFFLENIRKFDIDTNQSNIDILSELYGPLEDFIDDKSSSVIKQVSINLHQELEKDIKTMNSENFEQLNLKVNLEIYFKYMNYFVFYQKRMGRSIKTDKLGMNDDSYKETNILMNDLKEILEKYQSMKENFYEENIMHRIFTEDTDREPLLVEVKNTISLDLLFKLKSGGVEMLDMEGNAAGTAFPFNNVYSLSRYNESNTVLIETVNKLFKADPNSWQNTIVKAAHHSIQILESIIKHQLPFLFQFIFIDFNKFETPITASHSHHYKNFLNLVEFLRLHCEDHNKMFQTYLLTAKYAKSQSKGQDQSHHSLDKANFSTNEAPASMNPDYSPDLFINFIFRIPAISLSHIQYFKIKSKSVLKYFKEPNTTFFNDLILSITDFLVEIIQGAFPFNFKNLSENPQFIDYYEVHYKCLDSLLDEQDYDVFIANFVRFINCFIEENSNKLENKISLIKKLNPKKLVSIMTNCFKNLYMEYCSIGGEWKEMKKSENNALITQIYNKNFTRNCHLKLINQFILKEEEFLMNSLFIITSGIFSYLKRISHYKVGDKVKKILDSIEKSELGGKNKQQWMSNLKREMSQFLNKIVKNVEISFKVENTVEEAELKKYKIFFESGSGLDLESLRIILCQGSNESVGLDNVIFLVNSNSLFLQQSDYYKFLEKAPYDNFNSKLTFIFDYFNELCHTLEMRRELEGVNSFILGFLFKLDYMQLEVVSAFFSFATCALIFVSIRYQYLYAGAKEINAEVPDEQLDEAKIEKVIEFRDPYKYYISIVSISHLVLLMLIILNWIIFSFIRLCKSNDNSENNRTKSEGVMKKIGRKINNVLRYLALFIHPEIFPFIWNLIFGLIATLHANYTFLYALQLFTIFNIIPTMSSVLFAVRIRYKQFLSTGFLLIILMLFYASVTFYFFRPQLYDESIKENICDTFLQCFLYLINYGIRSGEGVHFSIKSINRPGYWSEFIFSWVFYFIVILIVLNIVNGIIVDTFQALREQNNERDDVRVNECYICSLNRAKFEIKGINFENHRLNEHHVLNYFEYLIKIKYTEEHDLNSLDFQVLNSMKDKKTDFFPVKKAKCFMSDE